MATILITGGTGMIGSALTKALLERDHHVIILSRHKHEQNETGKLSYALWDVEKGKIDKDAFAKADYLVHLAGAGIADKRWTNRRKKVIVSSRVDTGRLLIKAFKEYPNRIKAIIGASAIGWYGSDSEKSFSFTEDDPADEGFLGQACKAWEDSFSIPDGTDTRSVIIRIGIVLSNEGGFLKEFKRPVKWGLATILGNGRQIISWIHIDDLTGIFIKSIEENEMSGVYNVVAPNPVSNKDFVLNLAHEEKGKFFIPVYVPSFALKIALGELSIEVLKSTTVSCDRLIETGYNFLYPTVADAIKDLKK